jgi:hypothetical protein
MQMKAGSFASGLIGPSRTRVKNEGEKMKIPATTYFPRELPPKYLRRWRA